MGQLASGKGAQNPAFQQSRSDDFSMMIAYLFLAPILVQGPVSGEAEAVAPKQEGLRQIAVIPWSFKEGTDTAVQTAKEAISKILQGSNFEVVPWGRTKMFWEERLGMPVLRETLDAREALPELPSPTAMLKLGKLMGVQYVCAGRASWHTRSIWVTLGPKTKADCTVDTVIVDVDNAQVVLDARNVKADSTRKEAGLETAGALLVTWWITLPSGGPKTPHQQRAAVLAISDAFKPFVQSSAAQRRKIPEE